MPAKISLIGQTFGRLKVIEELPPIRSISGASVRVSRCICSCGEEVIVRNHDLKSGATKSCGCYHVERIIETHTKHGLTPDGHRNHTYQGWASMHDRCRNPKNKYWKNYGGRGVKVCERWNDFRNFLSDMGEKPKGLTIERIDNDGNYEPGNCKWATRSEQARNKRSNRVFTISGVTGCMVDLCAHFGISVQTVSARLNRGKWTPEQAFLTSTSSRRPNRLRP